MPIPFSSNKPNVGVLALALSCFLLQAPLHAQPNTEFGSSPFSVRRRFLEGGGGVILCLVTLDHTLETNGMFGSEHPLCTPIVGGELMDIDTEFELPTSIKEKHKDSLVRGRLIVSVTDSIIDSHGRLVVGDTPSFNVVDEPSLDGHRERHLMEPTGTKTVAIVRISTRDHPQENSVAAIDKAIFGDGSISFVTQMRDCSHGELQFQKADHGIIDVTLPGDNAFYDNDSGKLVAEAQIYLQQHGYGNGMDLADRTIFCLPQGFGTWAARAGMNHWRVTMNHGWCLSLSAAMHELGHTIGLGHADEMGGYMGASFRNSDWPRKCYNGYNYHHLGWFDDRTLTWNTDLDDVALATFVDYDKTTTDEPVLINVANKYYIQYNVKKQFNANTDGIPVLGEGKVTIHATLLAEDTEQLGALAEGEVIHLSSPNVYIKACRAYTSTSTGTDIMHISFSSQAPNLCQNEIPPSSDRTSSGTNVAEAEGLWTALINYITAVFSQRHL